MPQLRCVATLQCPAQKLQCDCTAVSHKSQIHFNLKCGDAAVTCARKHLIYRHRNTTQCYYEWTLWVPDHGLAVEPCDHGYRYHTIGRGTSPMWFPVTMPTVPYPDYDLVRTCTTNGLVTRRGDGHALKMGNGDVRTHCTPF